MARTLILISLLIITFTKCYSSEEIEKRDAETDDPSVGKVEICSIYLFDTKTGAKWDSMTKKKNIHLVKYNLNFIEYKLENLTDPTTNLNGSQVYKLNSWYHIFTEQGKKLLALALNYDVVALDLLALGVEELDLEVVDGPDKCLVSLSPKNKISAILNFVSFNFPVQLLPYQERPYCYQKVEKDGTKGKFVYDCCNDEKTCIAQGNDHIKYLYLAILVLKIIFFLICPWIIQKLFFQRSLEQVNYTVPISRPGLKKTMLIKRVNSEYETVNRSTKFSNTKLMHQFSNFRKLVKPIPSDEIVSVNFCRLDVVVDHSELMSKHESPVQLLQYLYANLIRCDCTKSDPFKTCCGESLVGSWSPSFLWCKLQKKCETNNSCRECCPWLAIFRCFSNLLFIAALPCLFYLRLLVFYVYEKDEHQDRRDFLDYLGLKYDEIHILTQVLSSHFCYLGLILCYITSFIVFAIIKTLFHKQIDAIINKCVSDFKNVNRFECFRMIASHVTLPFEKFGICGLIVGAFYWPIVIPISILLTMFYCIPLLYMTGRLLIHERPSCLESFPSSSARSQNFHSISRSVSSLTSCFFLDFISPNNRDACLDSQDEKTHQKSRTLLCISFSFKKITSFLKNILLGLLLITILLSLCVMYAESFGFIVEVFSLLFLCALLNTDDKIIYFVFTCFMLLHLFLALHYVKKKYLRFSQRLFRSIQLKLQQDILDKVMRNRVCKENYAFKYFAIDDINERNLRSSTDLNCNEAFVNESTRAIMKKYNSSFLPMEQEKEDIDNIEYISGRLHWTVNSLVLFIDENDNAYMPRNLFWTTCILNTLDSPGPVWKTLIKTSTALVMSMMYLALLLLLFLFVREIDGMSSIAQVFIFFICCSVPSIAYIALQCFIQQKTSEYIIGEKILWLIKNYRRSWPVSDLVFENPESPRKRTNESRLRFTGIGDQHCLDNSVNPPTRNDEFDTTGSSRIISSEYQIPLKVDLLITLKDEDSREGPLRGSLISNGSAQSLSSITRVSPEENRPSRTIAQPNTYAMPTVQFVNQLQKPLLLNTGDNVPSDALPPIEIELNDLKTSLENQVPS